MEQDCVLVRYGEIALKGGNRDMFYRALKRNILRMLAYNGITTGKVERISGRLLVHTKDTQAPAAIGNVFGVTSTSPAVKTTNNIEEIKNKALEILQEPNVNSFRVTANRLEKTFNATSIEINQKVGEHLKRNTSLRVDLTNPGLDIGIDLTKNHAYFYTQKTVGVGGLPVGVSGRVFCLLSGGIDSPVAAWLAMKRGCDVTLLHFLHDEHDRKPWKIQQLKDKLGVYHPDIKLIYVPTREIEKEIITKAPAKIRIILLRRAFMKIASKLCKKTNAKAIVTGDNIGQVASQTLDNLNVIDEAAGILTIRPLAGLDKREIIDLANKIGTYETSIQPYIDCCSFLLPKHPETKASIEEVRKTEEQVDANLLDKAVEHAYEG